MAYLYKLSRADLKKRIEFMGDSNCSWWLRKSKLVKRLQQLVPESGLIATSWVGNGGAPPPCPCGGVMHRIYGSTIARSGCRCDLCSKAMNLTDGLWTCINGADTMFHPAYVDVC